MNCPTTISIFEVLEFNLINQDKKSGEMVCQPFKTQSKQVRHSMEKPISKIQLNIYLFQNKEFIKENLELLQMSTAA